MEGGSLPTTTTTSEQAVSLLGGTNPTYFIKRPVASKPADLLTLRTFGTREQPKNRSDRPSPLEQLFHPPSGSEETPRKVVRISSQNPSVIDVFGGGSGSETTSVRSVESGEEADDEDELEEDEQGEALRRLEESGLQAILVYEKEPPAEEVVVAGED